jgi:hypothetical protein
MPRLTDSNSGPIDFCLGCFPAEGEAAERYQFEVKPTANDGRGDCFEYECDHPDYECDDYTCHMCGCELTRRDN